MSYSEQVKKMQAYQAWETARQGYRLCMKSGEANTAKGKKAYKRYADAEWRFILTMEVGTLDEALDEARKL